MGSLSLAFVTWTFARHPFGFAPSKEAQGVLEWPSSPATSWPITP
jgi:hypothetical protein